MSAHRKLSARGIVIARTGAGEGSSRVLLYTDTIGSVYALAKSAREERSKLRPHLLEGTHGTFTLVKGRDTWRVTGATDTQNVFFELGERAAAKEAAARVLSSVKQFIRGDGPDPTAFEALSGFFTFLPSVADEAIPAAECIAVLKMLSALGYVREGTDAAAFVSSGYDAETLARAAAARAPLLRAVNEAIAASGL